MDRAVFVVFGRWTDFLRRTLRSRLLRALVLAGLVPVTGCGGEERGQREVTLPVVPEAALSSARPVSSSSAAPLRPGPNGMFTRGLVVGVSRYKYSAYQPGGFYGLNDLGSASQDATAVASVFGAHLAPPGNWASLTDEAATTSAVRAGLAKLEESAGPGQTILVYFACHGKPATAATEVFYVLHDTDPRQLAGTGLSMDAVNDVLKAMQRKGSQVLLVSDACHSGGLGSRDVEVVDFSRCAGQASYAQLFSCMRNESSQEEADLALPGRPAGQGIFTYFMVLGVMGLADEDGDLRVSIKELAEYVHREVKREAASRNRTQTPWTGGPVDSTFEISRLELPKRLRSLADGQEMALLRGGLVRLGNDNCAGEQENEDGDEHPPADGRGRREVPAIAKGQPRAAGDEAPEHEVVLSPFYVDIHEVRTAHYSKFVTAAEKSGHRVCRGAHPLEMLKQHRVDRLRDVEPSLQMATPDEHPVVSIDWLDAVSYANWSGKRLPTEAEWEGAAGAQHGYWFPWGNEPPDKLTRANILKDTRGDEVRDHTVPVESTQYGDGRSPEGVWHLVGNVKEWCHDWFSVREYQALKRFAEQGQSAPRDPRGPQSSDEYGRVIRGGAYGGNPESRFYTRSHREYAPFGGRNERPLVRDCLVGFRCAVSAYVALNDPEHFQVLPEPSETR
ncbi:MAG: SUMF1/EgtB/PvdO family nonheme iron enzyme [Candidatus Riflebacteria bacterium]|nr:SUMF1/EgtB/PvdO family nonheme iron enzyme [Candidatus Riflebacteria bacterium]